MVKFLIFLPLQLLSMILCYLTNWIVVLFADEDGELKGLWQLWQTWDDSVDNKYFVLNQIPKIFRYDFDKYNKEYKGGEDKYGRRRYYVKNLKPLPLKDRIKRYFCRVGWLNRNCGYGFAFYLLGTWVDNRKMIYNDSTKYKEYSGHEKGWRWLFDKPFVWKSDRPITKHLQLNCFIGWKASREIKGRHRAMIANRIAVRIRKNK